MTVWDPIDLEVKAHPPETMAISQSTFAGLVRSLTLPALIITFIGFFVAVFSDSWRVPAIGAITVSFAFLLFGDQITGQTSNRAARVANAARAAGHFGGTRLPKDKIARLANRIRNLMVVRIGGSIPLVLEHEIWGNTKENVPFWMGLSLNASQAFFGGPKAAVRSNPKQSHGEMAMFIVAYKLDRDTGIRAEIMPEFVTAKGPMDRDIKTESVEFNAKYNIRLTKVDGQKVNGREPSAALLQVLTPATQVVFIGLAEAYAARAIIDGDTVFFGGCRNFQTVDDTALQGLLTQAVEDFAVAATAFKTYAE